MSWSVARRLKNLIKRTTLYQRWNDRRIASWLSTWTDGDEKRKTFYAGFVKPGDVCFDVGANVGNRTKIFLALGAKVVAVEPQVACQRVLRRVYGHDRRVALVPAALGAAPGSMEMIVNSNAPIISSLSTEWVEAVRATGRFGDVEWDSKQTVEITTLDRLIADHGVPSFVKIDVEGFEHEVLKGLTRTVPALSLEFTPECFDVAEKCVRHLQRLGPLSATYSLGESMAFARDWTGPDELLEELSRITDTRTFGDIYVRFARPVTPR